MSSSENGAIHLAVVAAATNAIDSPAVALLGARPVWPGQIRDLVELTKPRVTCLVVATTFSGFYLSAHAGLPFTELLHTLLGTWLVASAAAVMNEVYEHETDAAMRRTRQRPIPAGRVSPDRASTYGIVLAVCGILELGVGVNTVAAAFALLSQVVYVGVYTPLKPRTPLALLVGAVPGALPPVIGYAAARNGLGLGALVLFAIMFFWQVPHFLAIAWMCREDYRRAGFKVLSVVDENGRRTAAQTVIYTALLVAVTLVPAGIGHAGLAYLAGIGALDVVLFALALAFVRAPHGGSGRRLFLASLVYLPLTLAAVVLAWR